MNATLQFEAPGTIYEWTNRLFRDYSQDLARNLFSIRDAFNQARIFVANTKLAMSGPPVREGGPPGPSPGSFDEPVLHRDTGALSASVFTEIPDQSIEQMVRAVSRMPRYPYDGPEQVTLVIGVEDMTASDGTNTGAYAQAHEFAFGRMPMRPFFRPGVQLIIEAIDAAMQQGGG